MPSSYGSYSAPQWMNSLGLESEEEVKAYLANVGGTPGRDGPGNSKSNWRNRFYGKQRAYTAYYHGGYKSEFFTKSELNAQRAWLSKGNHYTGGVK